ncbi:hypothetical protein KFK09_019305 [Dendrobium nobile]|uniref:Uncharacterized protein n=1 Tax=Dendrobium nobile TaxID=94219 RepID=A0A8T3AY73_DENNO|nr:hypothetical protein KFK09_019305 [Dendrobium nobile]
MGSSLSPLNERPQRPQLQGAFAFCSRESPCDLAGSLTIWPRVLAILNVSLSISI